RLGNLCKSARYIYVVWREADFVQVFFCSIIPRQTGKVCELLDYLPNVFNTICFFICFNFWQERASSASNLNAVTIKFTPGDATKDLGHLVAVNVLNRA